MWNYKPDAARLAEELQKEFDVEAKLVAGGNGIFDVIVDGETIFSKSKTDRFPEPGEITKQLKE